MTTEQVRIDFLVTGKMSNLQTQIEALNASLMQTAGTVNMLDRSFAKLDVQAANRQFAKTLTMSNMFDSQMVNIQSHTESYGKSLENATLSGRRLWSESYSYIRRQKGEIQALAKEQIRLQNSVVQPLGKTAGGTMQAQVFTPTGLDMTSQANKIALANKQWQIFNANSQLAATRMVNLGKNTQWAGRQLMVGFTVPLAIVGALAAKTFNDMDQELVRLQKVYGSGLTFGDDFKKQSLEVRDAGIQMAQDMAKAYGVAGTETTALMADLAATGAEGADLDTMTRNTTKLAVLGEVDRQEAMKATVSLQTAFKMSTDEVAQSVNFLNAVENQTSTSLQDLVEAIPRAGTVVNALGGDVQDLALYMTAFREGGISAAEGANALKSGLSSIIAPPQAAVDFLKELGINLPKIVDQNAGDLTGTIVAFQGALDGLDNLSRQQAITKLFGKYQFARMNALFNNLGKQGSQTLKVMDLMGTSAEDLGKIADQEVKSITESASGKFKIAVESMKLSLMDFGETAIKVATWVVDKFASFFGWLNDHPFAEKIITGLALIAAGAGVVIMSMGLFLNMMGMLLKGGLGLANVLRSLAKGQGLPTAFKLLTAEGQAAGLKMEFLEKTLYNQKTAEAILGEATATLAEQYANLGLQAQLAGDKIVTSMDGAAAATQQAMVAGSGLSGPLVRGHILAEGMPDSQRSMVNDSFTQLTAAERAQITAGTHYPNLGRFGYTMVSAESNRLASNTPQFFSGTKSGPLSTSQQAASVEANKFFEHMRANLQNAGVQEDKINRWEMEAQAKIGTLQADVAAGRVSALNAERVMVETMAGIVDITTMKQRGVTSNIMKKGSDFDSPTRDEYASVLTSKQGMAGSVSTRDQQLVGATTKTAAALETAAVETTKLSASEIKMRSAADLARVEFELLTRTNNELARTQVSLVEGSVASRSAMNSWTQRLLAATTGLVEDDIMFQKMSVAGQEYAVALNKATGQVLSVRGYSSKTGAIGKEIDTEALSAEVKAAANAFGETVVKSAETSAKIAQEAAKRSAEISNAAAKAEADMELSSAVDEGIQENTDAVKEGVQENADAVREGVVEVDGAFREEAVEIAGGAGKGGFMSKMGGGKGMGLMMAGTMLPQMIPTGDNAAANTAVNTVSGAAMGAMMGSMILPGWGTAIGGIIGGAAPLVTSAINHMKEESDKRAAEAAATWETEFKSIEIDNEFFNSQGFKGLDKPIQLEFGTMDYAGYKLKDNSAEQEAAIKERYSNEIEAMKLSDNAVEYAKRFVNNLIVMGMDSEEAARIASTMLTAAGKSGDVREIGIYSAQTDRAAAEKNLRTDIASRKTDAFAPLSQELLINQIGGKGATLVQFDLDAMEKMGGEAGTAAGEAFSDEFSLAIQTGEIKNPKQAQAMYEKQMNQLVTGASKSVDWAALFDTQQGDAVRLMDVGIDVNQLKGPKELLDAIIHLGPEARDELLRSSDALKGPLLQSALAAEGASIDLAHTYRDSLGPEFANTVAAAEATTGAVNGVASAFINAKDAAREADLKSAFMGLTQKYYVPEDLGTKTNLTKLERQQGRAMERMQEAEDARLEAMQNRFDKQERIAQREIDQTQNKYDKEIEAVQSAEDKKQEAFQNEQDRFARRQEMRNLELSYDEAIANGNLFEAARIRMDMAAKKRQRQADKEEERRQKKADDKIAKLEKERDKKVKEMEKALRQEQRMHERAIEAAQDASDAKIAAAEKANKQILKDAKEANAAIQQAQDKSQELQAKMYQAFLDGNMQDFKKYADDLNLSAGQQAKIITGTLEDQFGKIPKKLSDSIKDGINRKNWSTIGQLVNNAIRGVGRDQASGGVAGQGSKGQTDGGHGSRVSNHAAGGYISGPGSGTSDSIPARLSNGEYVMRQAAVAKYGKSTLDKMNRAGTGATDVGLYASGGLVGNGILGGALEGLGQVITKSLSKEVGKGAGIGVIPGDAGNYAGTAFDANQLKNAATIIGVGKNLNASHRDIIIALMTAMQESTLHNYKSAVDHDSLGLFQQRPSMGWGTPKQITNPKYASRRFYKALFGVDGRDKMSLSEAAQAVQRSAYPDAYAKWEDEARAILSGSIVGGGRGGYVKPFAGNYPVGRTFSQHGRTGTDVPMPVGTALYATTSGSLTSNPYAFGSYGNWYTLGANGYGFTYAHLSRKNANSGPISAGQLLGYSGTTGNSTGPHLHFEARKGNSFSNQVDPHSLGIPGLRAGGKINFDNTLANLHRGETVLTAPLTKMFENNVANSGGNNYNFDVNIGSVDSEVDLKRAFSQFVTEHESKQRARNGRSRSR